MSASPAHAKARVSATAALLAAGLLACASPSGSTPRPDEPPATHDPAPAPAPSEASRAPTPSTTPAPPPATGESLDPGEVPEGALFVYREDDVTLSFTPPRRVTRHGSAGAPCTYELGDEGNMVSGREVEQAWRNPEVQNAVSGSKAFMAPDDLLIASEVRGADGRIAWTPACGGLCVGGPPGVVALLRVLHVMAVNVRGVCKG